MERTVSLMVSLFLVASCSGEIPFSPADSGIHLPDANARPDAPVDAPARDAPADAPADAPVDAPGQTGAPCESDGGLACAGDLLCCAPCCVPGTPAVCTPAESNDAGIGVGQCPLPDLTVDLDDLRPSVTLERQQFDPTSCEIQEGCIEAAGERRLLSFTTTTPNFGTADLALGDPATSPLFEWSPCHGHYHFKGYARYRLLDASGTVVVRGRKQAFCLTDLRRYDSFPLARPNGQFDCNGISRGWADIYGNGLACQYLDITNVPAGSYTLEITVNPDRVVPELRYDNNTVTVPVVIPAPPMSPTDPCDVQSSGLDRECGFVNGGTFSCTPGALESVGCGCGLGSCTGDTIMRVCPGTTVCAAPGLAQNDDCGVVGGCSSASFTCPASGQYTVLYGPYGSGDSVTCTLAHQP